MGLVAVSLFVFRMGELWILFAPPKSIFRWYLAVVSISVYDVGVLSLCISVQRVSISVLYMGVLSLCYCVFQRGIRLAAS
jgi:hypothetical protein